VVIGLAAVGTGVGLTAGAADRGSSVMAAVLAGFVVAFGFGTATYLAGLRRWLRGGSFPPALQLVQMAGLAACFGVMYLDVSVGIAMLAGLIGGLLGANVWAIRAARANRDRVDAAEAAIDRRGSSAADAESAAADDGGVATQDAQVGRALRETLAAESRRSLAWLIAAAVAMGACLVVAAPASVSFIVVSVGALAVVWVLRRRWAAWLALQDFMKAATPPRRAFVVLLHDPAPRMIRPLLGVWSEPPAVRGGRMPTPERVYRCDEELDALQCYQGNVVVHEAWVDTGPRPSSKPRWVDADAGVALPHRRAVFGRWYLASLIGGERPEAPARLTLRPPQAKTTAASSPRWGGASPCSPRWGCSSTG